MTVEISQDRNAQINDMVDSFAAQMDESASEYVTRRAASRAMENIKLGKKAEFMVAIDIGRHTGVEPAVDLEIRRGRAKGWLVDIEHARLGKLHVKSCDGRTVELCGEETWTFQCGTTATDELFKRESGDDCCAFVFMERWELPAARVVYCKLSHVVPHLRDPVMRKYVGQKRCLYGSSLGQMPAFNLKGESCE